MFSDSRGTLSRSSGSDNHCPIREIKRVDQGDDLGTLNLFWTNLARRVHEDMRVADRIRKDVRVSDTCSRGRAALATVRVAKTDAPSRRGLYDAVQRPRR